jgi:hypothetical protein
LVLCHYEYHVFEECHYYSTNRVSATTIFHLFEEYHYVRKIPYRAHLQMYWTEERERNVILALFFNLGLPSSSQQTQHLPPLTTATRRCPNSSRRNCPRQRTREEELARGRTGPRRRTHAEPSSPAREADPLEHVAAPSPRCGVRRGEVREQPPPAKSATSAAPPSNRRRPDLPHLVGSTLNLSSLPSMAHTGGNRRSLAASPPLTRARSPSCRAPSGVGPVSPLLAKLLLLGVLRASPLAVCPHGIM